MGRARTHLRCFFLSWQERQPQAKGLAPTHHRNGHLVCRVRLGNGLPVSCVPHPDPSRGYHHFSEPAVGEILRRLWQNDHESDPIFSATVLLKVWREAWAVTPRLVERVSFLQPHSVARKATSEGMETIASFMKATTLQLHDLFRIAFGSVFFWFVFGPVWNVLFFRRQAPK